MPPGGIEMELTFRGKEVVDAFVWDAMPLDATEGVEILRARPSTHVPIGSGDRTLVSKRVKLAK
jgi:hypothetical protein